MIFYKPVWDNISFTKKDKHYTGQFSKSGWISVNSPFVPSYISRKLVSPNKDPVPFASIKATGLNYRGGFFTVTDSSGYFSVGMPQNGCVQLTITLGSGSVVVGPPDGWRIPIFELPFLSEAEIHKKKNSGSGEQKSAVINVTVRSSDKCSCPSRGDKWGDRTWETVRGGVTTRTTGGIDLGVYGGTWRCPKCGKTFDITIMKL